jgi:hypothetical protein
MSIVHGLSDEQVSAEMRKVVASWFCIVLANILDGCICEAGGFGKGS